MIALLCIYFVTVQKRRARRERVANTVKALELSIIDAEADYQLALAKEDRLEAVRILEVLMMLQKEYIKATKKAA